MEGISKENLLKREYADLVANPDKVYAQNPLIIEAAHLAMGKWADIKVGEALSNSTHVTNTYEIPKHILDEYAKQEAIGFVKWIKGSIHTLWMPIGNNQWQAVRPSKLPIEQEIITSEQLYNLYLESKK
jgi:hypothetical protein